MKNVVLCLFTFLTTVSYGQNLEKSLKTPQQKNTSLYSYGKKTSKDKDKAFQWYKKSAEQGDYNSQFYLARMYYKGEGTPQDKNKAFYWYKKSAEQDIPMAQFNLGEMYLNGEGTSKDKVKGNYWIVKSFQNDSPKAKKFMEEYVMQKHTKI